MAKKRGNAEPVQKESRLQGYLASTNLVLKIAASVITILLLVVLIGFLGEIIAPQEFVSGNVAVIPIKGVILAGGGDSYFEELTSSVDTVAALREADEDISIQAVILDINSPGGAPVASDDIVQQVRKMNKTVVAVIGDIGTSGAYWVASASDRIFANEVSITGSIGVIGSYVEVAKLLEDYNVTYRRVVSGKYKDIGSPLKEMTDEEGALLQNTVDKMRDYFVRSVAQNRGMKLEDVSKLATGAFYLGSEAKENGLVDEMGNFYDAISYIESKHNITAELVEYTAGPTFLESLMGVFNKNSFFVGRGIGSAVLEAPQQSQSAKVWA